MKRFFGLGVSGNRLGGVAGNFADKAIAAFRDGFDKARRVRRIFERVTDFLDDFGQRVVADERAFPDEFKELLFFDRPPAVFEQHNQNIEGARRQSQVMPVFLHAKIFDVNRDAVEAVNLPVI